MSGCALQRRGHMFLFISVVNKFDKNKFNKNKNKNIIFVDGDRRTGI